MTFGETHFPPQRFVGMVLSKETVSGLDVMISQDVISGSACIVLTIIPKSAISTKLIRTNEMIPILWPLPLIYQRVKESMRKT